MDGQNFEQQTNEQPVYQQMEQPAYQQGYVAPAEPPKKTNGQSIAAFVLGIVGTVLACCSPIVGIICGVVGLSLGIVGNKKLKSGLGTAGIALSIIALVVGVGMWIANIIALSQMESGMNELINQLNQMSY